MGKKTYTVSQVIVFIFSAYASYKIPATIFTYFNWDLALLQYLISLALCSLAFLYVHYSVSKERMEQKQEKIQQLERNIKEVSESIESAMKLNSTRPLEKHCTEDFVERIYEDRNSRGESTW